MPWAKLLLLALAVPLAGCFTADLDPSLSGVFACEDAEECAEGQICAMNVCLNEEDVPFVRIIDPPPQGTVDLATYGGTFEVTVETNLELVEQGSDPSASTGFILGTVAGGTNVAVVDEGTGQVTLSFNIDPPETGQPLRIAVGAMRADDVMFPNDEARDTRLFWFDDGSPQVAFAAPWPEKVFPATRQTAIDVTIATLNFELAPAGSGSDPSGHVHLYQRNLDPDVGAFPAACLATRFDCDGEAEAPFYDPLIPAAPTTLFETQVGLNPDPPPPPDTGTFLGVVLINDDHSSFDDGSGSVVRDIVPIVRMGN